MTGSRSGYLTISFERAVELLRGQIEDAEELLEQYLDYPEAIDTWTLTTRNRIQRVFGENSKHATDFLHTIRLAARPLQPKEGYWQAEHVGVLVKSVVFLGLLIDEARLDMESTTSHCSVAPEFEHQGNLLIDPVCVEGAFDYVKRMVEQANGCYRNGWYDACAVLVRRLVEVMIIDSFDTNVMLDAIKTVPGLSGTVPNPLTAAAVTAFVSSEFGLLTRALDLVVIANDGVRGGEQGMWLYWNQYVTPKQPPHDVQQAFRLVLEVRKQVRRGMSSVSRNDLVAARQGTCQILSFLEDQFPQAGIEVPGSGEIVPLSQLIETYLAPPEGCWHIERGVGASLRSLKAMGDIGAHGRYRKVTRQTLDKCHDNLEAAIQQLVGTAYSRPRRSQ